MDVKSFAKVFDIDSRQVLFYKDDLTDDQIAEQVKEENERVAQLAEDDPDTDEEPSEVAPYLIRSRFYLLDGSLSEMSFGFGKSEHRDDAFGRLTRESAEAAVEQVKWMEDILAGRGDNGESEED